MTDARDPSKAPDIFTALGLDEPIGDDLVNLPEPGEDYLDPGPRQPPPPSNQPPVSPGQAWPPPAGAPYPAPGTGTPPSGFQPAAAPVQAPPAPGPMPPPRAQMPPPRGQMPAPPMAKPAAPKLPPPTRPRRAFPPPVAPALDIPDEEARTNERKRPSTAEIAAAGPDDQRFSGLANMLEPDKPRAPGDDFSAFEALDAELRSFGNEGDAPIGAEPIADPLEGLDSGSALPVFADKNPATAPAKPPSTGGRRRVAPPRQPPPGAEAASASASAQRVLNASASGPAPVRGAGPVDSIAGPVIDDDEPVRRGGGATTGILVAVCVLLAGGFGWVLYTQTDLFAGGDLIERRQEEARAEVEKKAAEIQADRDRNKKEYGTIMINSSPKGARVWLVAPGPEAEFPNLPVDGEYLVAVVARGHAPRIRIVKGTELKAPVILDLDPVDDREATPPVPPSKPPKVPQGARETDVLKIKSNTEGAELMLMVGYTPGAQLSDVEVTTPHHVRVTLDGHEPHDILIKGRHYEESGNGKLAFSKDVELTPREG